MPRRRSWRITWGSTWTSTCRYPAVERYRVQESTCLQEWYVKYCAETGEFCDQIKVTHTHNSHNRHEDEAAERPTPYTYGEHSNEMKMN